MAVAAPGALLRSQGCSGGIPEAGLEFWGNCGCSGDTLRSWECSGVTPGAGLEFLGIFGCSVVTQTWPGAFSCALTLILHLRWAE